MAEKIPNGRKNTQKYSIALRNIARFDIFGMKIYHLATLKQSS
jgi:hypothetical protein